MTNTTRTRIWWIYLAGGLLVTLAYLLLEAGGLAQDLLYDVVGVSGAIALVVGVAIHRPDRRAPWLAGPPSCRSSSSPGCPVSSGSSPGMSSSASATRYPTTR